MNEELLKNNARAFKIAGDRCFEQKQIGINIQFVPVPGIINYAFSIELYLKLLLQKSGNTVQGHELKNKLFDKLEDSSKNRILELSKFEKTEFENLLEEHEKAFVEWRYLHEKDVSMKVNPDFLQDTIHCLSTLSEEIV